MMNTIGFSPVGLGFHMLGALAVLLGIALLLFWAFKHFSEAELWKWGWVLVVIGLVACLLSGGMGAQGMMRYENASGTVRMMNGGNAIYFDDEVPGPGMMKFASSSSVPSKK
jgi:hypothetical protein